MPQTTPWISPLRGSSDGVKARQPNSSATHAPGSVRWNQRRRLTAGAALVAPLGGGVSVLAVVVSSARSLGCVI